MNKCKIELTKEELYILTLGVDYQLENESVVFDEYGINKEEFSKKLKNIFYSLKWKED